MQWSYLIGLLVVIGCLLLVDRAKKLAFFHDAKRTGLTLGICVWLFIAWDIFGIILGIFFHGDSGWTLPYRLFPEFPVEEIVFLFLLTYVSLLLYRFATMMFSKENRQ